MLQQTLIGRKQYMQQLRDLRDQNVIKVISGVCRCGKSTLLQMFADELQRDSVLKSPNLSKQEILANFIYFGSILEYAKQLAISEKQADLFAQSILKTVDSTPKCLLTTDIDHNPVYDGIRKLNVVDWMLQNG